VPAHVEARVGDVDPLTAAEDALRTFPADELVIVTRPEDEASWLEKDVPSILSERFGLPVKQVVDDAGDVETPVRSSAHDGNDGETLARAVAQGRSQWTGFIVESTVLLVIAAVAAGAIAVAVIAYVVFS
jgi:hypothetical protein